MVCNRQCLKQALCAEVAHGAALTTGLSGQYAGKVGLSTAGGACEKNVLMPCYPLPGQQCCKRALLQSTWMRVIDVIGLRLDFQLCCFQQACYPGIATRAHLPVNKQRQPLIEAQIIVRRRLLELLFVRIAHAGQFQCAQ